MTSVVRHRTSLLFALVAGTVLTGCTPIFPKATLDGIDRSISFRDLQKSPGQFKGSRVMLAGVILSIKNSQQSSLLEILQKPMDSDGMPLDTDKTEGRFLVESDQYLDPAVYHRGRSITTIGDIEGSRSLLIDEVQYQYPLLKARALHLWTPSSGPRFFFGIGVSGRM